MTSRTKLLGGGLAVCCAAAALFVWRSYELPADSPLARMYRTEADLAMLVNAVQTYRSDFDSYPPSGQSGLRLATVHLSRNGNYLPDGPPRDGWDQPFVYEPHTGYDLSEAQSEGPAFAAPETFQLYSVGADGHAGLNEILYRRDNITSWQSPKPWRAHYRELQLSYSKTRDHPQ